MSDPPLPTGKLPAALLRELLASGPPLSPEVRVGPKVGEDACAIDVPAGTLVAATDPITLTGADVGAYAVAINANDVAVTGVRPRWFLAVVLMPPGTVSDEVRTLFDGMRAALAAADVALVGGHTEITAAVNQPVVIGQMLGIAPPGEIVTTGGMGVGDRVVQIGSAPIEGAAVLAVELGDRLGGVVPEMVERARRAAEAPGISVVEAALLAARLGASAMHDPTEGGLAAGLHELAEASGLAIVVVEDRVAWFEPGLAVCAAVGADPWFTLASGCLVAAFPGARADAAVEALRAEGHDAAIVGQALAGSGVRLVRGGSLGRTERDEVARLLADG